MRIIRKTLKKIVYWFGYKKLKGSVTLLGSHYNVGPHSSVVMKDGSTKSDVVLADDVDVFGCLYTQSGGRITVGHFCQLGLHSTIRSVESVSIGNCVVVSEGVIITDNNSHPTIPLFQWYRAQSPATSEMHLWKHSAHKPIIIDDNVWIGEFARICKGVHIGKNSIVGANSVVTKDVPDNCIVAGNPAKIVRTEIDKLPLPNTSPEFDVLISQYGRDF